MMSYLITLQLFSSVSEKGGAGQWYYSYAEFPGVCHDHFLYVEGYLFPPRIFLEYLFHSSIKGPCQNYFTDSHSLPIAVNPEYYVSVKCWRKWLDILNNILSNAWMHQLVDNNYLAWTDHFLRIKYQTIPMEVFWKIQYFALNTTADAAS